MFSFFCRLPFVKHCFFLFIYWTHTIHINNKLLHTVRTRIDVRVQWTIFVVALAENRCTFFFLGQTYVFTIVPRCHIAPKWKTKEEKTLKFGHRVMNRKLYAKCVMRTTLSFIANDFMKLRAYAFLQQFSCQISVRILCYRVLQNMPNVESP